METQKPKSDIAYAKIPLIVLFGLYLSQGLPYGFQAVALPLILREHGASRSLIGLLSAIAAPWAFKALWAPLLDRFYWKGFGRRKSWIIPMQLLLLVSIAATAAAMHSSLTVLLAAVFFMNLFAATQDIAVDGFAIDQLKPHALGVGNAVQTVGFKLGSILTGGALMAYAGTHGWDASFAIVGALTAAALVPILLFKEKPIVELETPVKVDGVLEEHPSLKALFKRMLLMVVGKRFRWVTVFILTYKLGEELSQTMYNLFLQDRGFSKEQIGTWSSTYGMGASMAGSFLGGMLIIRLQPWKMLGIAGGIRLAPMLWQWWLTMQTVVTPNEVIVSSCLEHFGGGMMTTAMFAFMMAMVEKKAGATEYTTMACMENLGRWPGKFASGFIADALGYSTLFFLAVLGALAAFLPWWKCKVLSEEVAKAEAEAFAARNAEPAI